MWKAGIKYGNSLSFHFAWCFIPRFFDVKTDCWIPSLLILSSQYRKNVIVIVHTKNKRWKYRISQSELYCGHHLTSYIPSFYKHITIIHQYSTYIVSYIHCYYLFFYFCPHNNTSVQSLLINHGSPGKEDRQCIKQQLF